MIKKFLSVSALACTLGLSITHSFAASCTDYGAALPDVIAADTPDDALPCVWSSVPKIIPGAVVLYSAGRLLYWDAYGNLRDQYGKVSSHEQLMLPHRVHTDFLIEQLAIQRAFRYEHVTR